MRPEEQARQDIDKQLEKANWLIQDRQNINLGAGPGIAVREFHTNAGPIDYALFVNRKAIGVVEAKPALSLSQLSLDIFTSKTYLSIGLAVIRG